MALLVIFILSSASGARGFEFDRQEPCNYLMQQTDQDRWALLEYRSDQSDLSRRTVDITHSSDAGYADQLLTCLHRGEARLPRPPANSHGGYKVLRFAPARGQVEVRGSRLLRYDIPNELRSQFSAPAFDGHVGLRVELNEFGMIRSQDLLFSSNGPLGDTVLDTLDESLAVVKDGREAGPYVDVIYLRFKDGALVNFSQSHFVTRSTP